MNGFQYTSGFFTHTGQRRRNEDFYILDELNGIYILADGMGGYPGGHIASRLASEACHDYIKSHPVGPLLPDDLIGFIRKQFVKEIRIHPEHSAMGTTLCCLYIREGCIHALHLGDSKIIVLTDSVFESRDHTYAQELMDHQMISSAEYQGHPMRHLLTKCLTVSNHEFKADYQKIPLQKGWNTILLCSDGVLETYTAAETIAMIKAEPDIDKILHKIEQHTLKQSMDNCTAVMVRYHFSRVENQ